MEPKPGFKTTEFWITTLKSLILAVVPILVVVGVLAPDTDAQALSTAVGDHVKEIVAGIVAICTAAAATWSVIKYQFHRTDLKKSSAEKVTSSSLPLLLVLLIPVFMAGCLGSHTRENVLLPAMESAWDGVREDASIGGASQAQLDAFEAALREDDRAEIVLQWPAIRAFAEGGIQSRLDSGDLSDGLADSLRTRLELFDESIHVLTEETSWTSHESLPTCWKRPLPRPESSSPPTVERWPSSPPTAPVTWARCWPTGTRASTTQSRSSATTSC